MEVLLNSILIGEWAAVLILLVLIIRRIVRVCHYFDYPAPLKEIRAKYAPTPHRITPGPMSKEEFYRRRQRGRK